METLLGIACDVLDAVTVAQIDAAVLAERERCAKIAEAAESAYLKALETVDQAEDWQWALNDMREATNETFFGGVAELRAIAEKIRGSE